MTWSLPQGWSGTSHDMVAATGLVRHITCDITIMSLSCDMWCGSCDLCREVSVLRLITQDTIEEGILQCAENKLKLEQDLNHINGNCVCRQIHGNLCMCVCCQVHGNLCMCVCRQIHGNLCMCVCRQIHGNLCIVRSMGTCASSDPWELVHRQIHGNLCIVRSMGTCASSDPWELVHRQIHGNLCIVRSMGTCASSDPWELVHRQIHGNLCIVRSMGTQIHGNLCIVRSMGTQIHGNLCIVRSMGTQIHGNLCIVRSMGTCASSDPWELVHRQIHGNLCIVRSMGTCASSDPWELVYRQIHGNLCIVRSMGTCACVCVIRSGHGNMYCAHVHVSSYVSMVCMSLALHCSSLVADGPSSADVALLLQYGLGQDGCVNAIKSHDM